MPDAPPIPLSKLIRFARLLPWLIVMVTVAFLPVLLFWPRETGSKHDAWMALSLGLGALGAIASLILALVFARNLTSKLGWEIADLENTQERFSTLMELSSDWFWEHDRDHRYTHMSGGTFEKVHFPQAMMEGKRRWEVPAFGITEQQWAEHKSTIDAHKPFVDLIYQRADSNDELHWLSVSGIPFFDGDGTFQGYRGISKDITQRKNSELQRKVEQALPTMLADAREPDAAMMEVIQYFAVQLGWDYAALWLQEGDFLQRRAMWTAPDFALELATPPETIALSTSETQPAVRAITAKTAQWAETQLVDGGPEQAASRRGIRSTLAFPLLDNEEAVGAIEVASRFRRRADSSVTALSHFVGAQCGQFLRRKKTDRELQYLASHDPLTHLPNRAAFEQNLVKAIARAERSLDRVAVMFIDLDRFKNINDTLGHEAGDRLLQQVAQRLAACVRQTDFVARLGGDEFVVIAEGFHSDADVSHLADKIVASTNRPYLLAGMQIQVTASVGVATHPFDGADGRTLLKHADIAMYRAKEQGSSYQVYATHMNPNSSERAELETQLSRAIENDEFELYYQPTIGLLSGAPTGVEALLRWNHPELGLISPSGFMALAEETGLIVPMGQRVFGQACRKAAAWQKEGWPRLRMAINISPRQFLRHEVVDDLSTAIAESGVEAGLIEVEITENVVNQNPDASVVLLEKIRALGVHIAMDDFGAGHSSLSLLRTLPIDRVKVDLSVIRNVPWDADNTAVTRALISLAHSLRREVLAEGVESESQLAFLRGEGCDEYQGYLYSAARPADEMEQVLQHALGEPGLIISNK